jgi:hypothetical protein
MFSLIPKDDVFFDLFEKASANCHRAARELHDFFDRYDDLEGRMRRIKELEHVGDELTHEVIERLNQTFITPLDREDIHEFVCRLDDILDRIDTAVDRVCLYKLPKPMELIHEMMSLLRRLRSANEVRLKVREVHRLESEADGIERQALLHLFEGGNDALLVIKWKNVIEVLESATDKCEDVANVIEGIVLKNA